MKMRIAILFLGLGGAVFAQTSTSYKLTEQIMNEGGHPQAGVVLGSTSYRVTLDAIGDGLPAPALGSASFAMAAGFVPVYPPPGEVQTLRIAANRTSMTWAPERSTGVYNIYRGLFSSLPGPYGQCRQANVPAASATISENPPPPAGNGYFYLVTAENRLNEEGTKGFNSAHVEHPNGFPCP